MKKLLLLAALLVALLASAVLAAVCISGNDVTVTWQASTDASGIASYDILRGATTDVADAVVVGTVDGATLTFTDSNVADGAYYYFVRAKDPCGNTSAASAPSNQVFVDSVDPTPPTDVHAG